MFLQQNNLDGLRVYFNQILADQFSQSEIKLMLKAFVTKRLKMSDTDFMLANDLRFSESDLLYFRSVVKRLQSNEPFQYIHGRTEFYGLELICDRRALIPRPETEELVDWIVQSSDKSAALNIVDLCAGSGCIAFGLKSIFRNATVEAWELSEDALELIKENERHTSLEIVRVKMDALSEIYPVEDESCDIIVSNPPYIPSAERSRMHANVLDFEPEMALFVNDADPFVFYQAISKEARGLLVKGGWLYFEIHEDFETEMIACLKQHGFVNIELRKDLQGRSRMIRGQRVPSRHEQ